MSERAAGERLDRLVRSDLPYGARYEVHKFPFRVPDNEPDSSPQPNPGSPLDLAPVRLWYPATETLSTAKCL